MLLRVAKRLSMLGLMLIPLACAPLPKAGAPGEGGTITQENLPRTDVVPLEWGRLVAAHQMASTNASALWFQDDSGTIRLVGFDHQTQKLWAQAGVLRRK